MTQRQGGRSVVAANSKRAAGRACSTRISTPLPPLTRRRERRLQLRKRYEQGARRASAMRSDDEEVSAAAGSSQRDLNTKSSSSLS